MFFAVCILESLSTTIRQLYSITYGSYEYKEEGLSMGSIENKASLRLIRKLP